MHVLHMLEIPVYNRTCNSGEDRFSVRFIFNSPQIFKEKLMKMLINLKHRNQD